MAMSSRERVCRCLRFETPDRMPRQLWSLPWAVQTYPDVMQKLRQEWPNDIICAAGVNSPSARVNGNPYVKGRYVDEWGCVFDNIHDGVWGEVLHPMLRDIADWKGVEPPYETLPQGTSAVAFSRECVNRQVAETDCFVLAGCLPRPWERFQFLLGTENAMCELMSPDDGARELLKVIHDYYLKELEFWVTTDVDGVFMMDDWGSQTSLLIDPKLWRELFRPLYKDYCDLAHAHGKFVFMHSDGYIKGIYEDLIQIGVNAINSQLFCMPMAEVAARFKGRITFWGEIDRQHVLPSTDPEAGRRAVRELMTHFYDPAGGLIGQYEFSVGTHPQTALAVSASWQQEEQRIRDVSSETLPV